MTKYRVQKTIDHYTNERLCVLQIKPEGSSRFAPLVEDGRIVSYQGSDAETLSELHLEWLTHQEKADFAKARLVTLLADQEKPEPEA
jgi:hypothetical protein